MNMIDLFSGIGGFRLAAQRVWGASLNCKCMVEIDPFCQKVLTKNWPGVIIHDDIKTFKGNGWGTIDLLTGGFPCQPFSVAGKQGGREDDRYLWPEMLRVIEEAKPRWVVGENVTGIINLALDDVLSSLENEGYTTQTFIIPAVGTDAQHRRNRVWIVANNEGGVDRNIKAGEMQRQEQQFRESIESSNVAYPQSIRLQRDGKPPNAINQKNGRETLSCRTSDNERGEGGWLPEPSVGRVADGVPNRVDRLRALGNAIVPQVAQRIFWGVRCVDQMVAE